MELGPEEMKVMKASWFPTRPKVLDSGLIICWGWAVVPHDDASGTSPKDFQHEIPGLQK